MIKSGTLTIQVDKDGNVGIEGPIDQKLFCYGLLEVAKEMIHDYHVKKAEAKAQPAIERPSPADVLAITGRNGAKH
jgi:hypothetical protein